MDGHPHTDITGPWRCRTDDEFCASRCFTRPFSKPLKLRVMKVVKGI